MRILVTGKNSYAGKEFVKRMNLKKPDWKIDSISVRTPEWESLDFSIYDAIYHVAAIVHVKESLSREKEYFEVNSELPYKIASKAKKEGVKSFVFLSSIAVYGIIGEIGKDIMITKETPVAPKTLNGRSKLKAEALLRTLQGENFNISFLRVPLIYGKNSPGNYKSLSNLAKKTPVFPLIKNKRSMIYIDHLSDIVSYIIKENLSGIYLVNNPQNFNTTELVNIIGAVHGKKIIKLKSLGTLLALFGNKSDLLKKIFGTVYYEVEATNISGFNYEELDFEDTVRFSEGLE